MGVRERAEEVLKKLRDLNNGILRDEIKVEPTTQSNLNELLIALPTNLESLEKAQKQMSFFPSDEKAKVEELHCRTGLEALLLEAYRLLTRMERQTSKDPCMDYHDFHLHVTDDFGIHALSERGEEKGALRLEVDKLARTLQRIENGQTNAQLLKGLGHQLYQAVFPPGVQAHLKATIALAEATDCGIRLRLMIESPKLSALPWEFLYDTDTNAFLSNSVQTVLSRYVGVPLSRRELNPARLPLRILLVISAPNDLEKLDISGEEALIREALAQHSSAGRIEIDVLSQPTIRNVNQRLRERSYNIFHFIGHGAFEDEKGYIALVNQNKTARFVDDETFANFFLGNRHVGLVILNACKTATTSSRRAFVGVAPHLVRRGIPAIIAMQYAILDDTAKLFADEFYRTLALGWPVDAAVQTTRNAISMEMGLDLPDFAAPVLFMRAKDGIILSGL